MLVVRWITIRPSSPCCQDRRPPTLAFRASTRELLLGLRPCPCSSRLRPHHADRSEARRPHLEGRRNRRPRSSAARTARSATAPRHCWRPMAIRSTLAVPVGGGG